MKESVLHEAALVYLSNQSASAVSLTGVLKRRVNPWARREGRDPELIAEAHAAIERIIARFQQNGLLDDVAFANGRAERLGRAGRSRRAIAAHLQQRGVAEGTVREALPEDDLPSAVTFARKRRMGPFAREPMDEAARKKAIGAMARAGFSFSTCNRVLRTALDEAAEITSRL